MGFSRFRFFFLKYKCCLLLEEGSYSRNYVHQAKISNSTNSWNNKKCSWYIYQVKGIVLRVLQALLGRYYSYPFFKKN